MESVWDTGIRLSAITIVPWRLVCFYTVCIQTDILGQAVQSLLARKPWLLILFPVWFLGGRPAFKRHVSTRIQVDPSTLPYHEEFLKYLREEKKNGRKLLLVTAADRVLVEPVAQYLGFFDGVIATDLGANLSGRAKARELMKRFGEGGFDYAGNESRDVHVWNVARKAIVVHANGCLVQKAQKRGNVERVFP
jgi:hypothetical protein